MASSDFLSKKVCRLRMRVAGWLYWAARMVDPPVVVVGPLCPDCRLGPNLPDDQECPYCRDAAEQQRRDKELVMSGYDEGMREAHRSYGTPGDVW